jgi:hypothetical protein
MFFDLTDLFICWLGPGPRVSVLCIEKFAFWRDEPPKSFFVVSSSERFPYPVAEEL